MSSTHPSTPMSSGHSALPSLRETTEATLNISARPTAKTGISVVRQASSLQAVDTILVQSRYNNIKGVYVPLEGMIDGVPAYVNENHGMALYRSPKTKRWRFGVDTADKEFIVQSNQDNQPVPDEPWHVQDWGDAVASVQRIQFRPPEAEVPDAIAVYSKIASIQGGYKLLGFYDNHAVYRREPEPDLEADDVLFFWFNSIDDQWILGSSVGDDTWITTVKSVADNLCNVPLDSWSKNVFEKIEEVDFLSKEEIFAQDHDRFQDPDFPTETALGFDLPEGKTVEWISANRLLRNEVIPFCVSMDPQELQHGQGEEDNWLLSAFGALAEHPKAVKELFAKTSNADRDIGKHAFNLFNVRSGQWEEVVVDDMVPCELQLWWRKKAKPIFRQLSNIASRQQSWPLLFEKAVAKMLGSYGALKKINKETAWAWQLITGQSIYALLKIPEQGRWATFSIDMEEQKNAVQEDLKVPWVGTADGDFALDDMKGLYKFLRDRDKAENMLAAVIPCELRGDLEGNLQSNGLVEGQAYAITQVVRVKSNKDGSLLRLIQLRNQFGEEAEWNGSWSKGSKEWNLYPDIGDQVKYNATTHDGTFWMSQTEFVDIFGEIVISQPHPWAAKPRHIKLIPAKNRPKSVHSDPEPEEDGKETPRRGGNKCWSPRSKK